jgi:hypothetical protein
MTAPKATIMPIATTVTTVRDNTRAPSKLPKTRPPSGELSHSQTQVDSLIAIYLR